MLLPSPSPRIALTTSPLVTGEGDSSVPCPILDLSPFLESPLVAPTAPLSGIKVLDPASLTSGVLDLVGQGVNDLATQVGHYFMYSNTLRFALFRLNIALSSHSPQLSGQFEETQQQLQQQLLDQIQMTVGADVLNAAADTTSTATKLFAEGFEMMSQQYSASDITKSLSNSFAAFNPFGSAQTPPTAPGPVGASKEGGQSPSTGAGAGAGTGTGIISDDKDKRKTSLTLEELPAQFISTALQATGLNAQGLAQLMSVGETVSGLSLMASDMTKGLTADFIEREMALLAAIMDGKAIEHHLEPSYYKALSKAADIQRASVQVAQGSDESGARALGDS